ncbi:MAG: DUF2752 domain-containing protein [Chitinophagaceae bacterium]|nr:DUF2752 domain-containing protein [Chitinophagaceae bacterium]
MSFWFLNIIDWLQQHQLPCLFRQLTHIDCPGCGMQRSFCCYWVAILPEVSGCILL